MSIRYMGSKRQLLPQISETIFACREGALLDLFSGMCAVGGEIAPSRQIWTNDSQIFASNMARAMFTSQNKPVELTTVITHISNYFTLNMKKLESLYKILLIKEEAILLNPNTNSLNALIDETLSFNLQDKDKKRLTHYLFSQNHAGGYFSLNQAMEIDSIRFAIDKIKTKDLISEEKHRWFLIALAQAMSNSSNTTGHFAQYLKIKENNLNMSVKQKQKSIWDEWYESYQSLKVIGSKKWRKKNKVFNECSLQLVSRIPKWKNKPSVVYADPPYTGAQYSRFYHLYETLFLYDYPEIKGIGQYRPDRFHSDFCLSSKVYNAMEHLIAKCSKAGCDLVLSYPEKAILRNSENIIYSMIKKYFKKVDVAHKIDHKHSSLGGSKGQQKYNVRELIFLAQ